MLYKVNVLGAWATGVGKKEGICLCNYAAKVGGCIPTPKYSIVLYIYVCVCVSVTHNHDVRSSLWWLFFVLVVCPCLPNPDVINLEVFWLQFGHRYSDVFRAALVVLFRPEAHIRWEKCWLPWLFNSWQHLTWYEPLLCQRLSFQRKTNPLVDTVVNAIFKK